MTRSKIIPQIVYHETNRYCRGNIGSTRNSGWAFYGFSLVGDSPIRSKNLYIILIIILEATSKSQQVYFKNSFFNQVHRNKRHPSRTVRREFSFFSPRFIRF